MIDSANGSRINNQRESTHARNIRRCAIACLICCWMASAAIADEGARPAEQKRESAIGHVIDALQGKMFEPALTAEGSVESQADGPNGPGSLMMEPETNAAYDKYNAASPYPATDSPDKLSLEQLETIAKLAPQASKDGVQTHPAMIPLFHSMVYRYTGGSYKNEPLRFRLHAPEPYEEGKKYPMVVWLHGAGECGDDNVDQLSHLHHIIPYLVGPKKRDFFLLVPQCPHTHVAWEAPEICSTTLRPDGSVECHVNNDPIELGNAPIAFTLDMIEAVLKDFPVAPNRVTVAGLSTGGEGVWRIVERRPDLFAAAVPVVSWKAMHDKSLREKLQLKKIPIWAIYSSDDNGIDFARKEFERMRDAGCNCWKTEFGVCGHRAWTPAMLQGDIFGWLISRAKDGQRYFAAEPSPTDPQTIGVFADVTEGDLKREPTKATGKPRPAESEAKVNENQQMKVGIALRKQMKDGDGHVTMTFQRSPTNRMVDQLRVDLVVDYVEMGQLDKAWAVADKVKDRQLLVRRLLHSSRQMPQNAVLDYIDRELDRMEKETAETNVEGMIVPGEPNTMLWRRRLPQPTEEPLQPIPAGKKSPKDECGKEWAMSPTTLYGLFPNGWEQESKFVPDYVVNETGQQLRVRLAKAFIADDLAAMRELCDSFIHLDDIPLSSPWFDTSGGRLQGRIKYALNDKAKPVVAMLRDIAAVKAESKKEFAELAQKSLNRIDAITHPKSDE